MKQLQADVVVIGGGTAGMGAFRNVRQYTDNVYLIENHAFGTTCARVGCMPSKLLIAAAEARHHALHTDPFGIHLNKDSITVNGEEVMNRVKSERDRFVGFVVEDVEAWPSEKRIMGSAKFIDEHTVQIDDHTQIRADRIVIATGSRPIVLPQWQALGDRLIINDDVFSWDTLPESVAVFGPGVIGLELGQALSRLGVKVEIFGKGGLIGGITDPVVLEEAKTVFGEELTLHLNADTEVGLNGEGNVEVKWREDGQSGTFTAQYLLAAVGRRPNTDNIGLENLDIELDERGVPKAHPLTMQTSIPHIFIAGDASNQLPLLHEASADCQRRPALRPSAPTLQKSRMRRHRRSFLPQSGAQPRDAGKQRPYARVCRTGQRPLHRRGNLRARRRTFGAPAGLGASGGYDRSADAGYAVLSSRYRRRPENRPA